MAYESQMARDARIDVGAVVGAVFRRLPRIILLTLLLLALAFAFTMTQPRLYESSASILVEPRNNVYFRSANDQAPSSGGGDAGVVSSQIELLKSRDTLLTVIDRLDLSSVPEFNGAGSEGFSPLAVVSRLLGRQAARVSPDEVALNTLYERLTVIQERDSRIISVLVRSTDPQLAADIANAVANAHVARRAQLSLSDTAEASSWLADEIAKLRVSVTAAETAVANFKVENDLFIGSNNTSLADQQLSTIATQISAAQERKNAALSRAALIRGMIERGQPIDGVADVRESVVIQQLNQEKARLQGEKAQRSATLLANHPTIQALTAQIAELDNQISIEGRRVADALDAEAEIEAGLEASLQADLARAKTSSSTATQDTVALDGLEREAAAQRGLLESYLQRYGEAVSRVDSSSALPDVRVVSIAAPSVSPASPKTSLILLAVGLVSLAAQVGIVVFSELISGRAIVPLRDPERAQDELDEVPFIEAELEPDQRWEDPVEPEPAALDGLDELEPEPEPEPVAVEPSRDIASRFHAEHLSVADPQISYPPEVVDGDLAHTAEVEQFIEHLKHENDVAQFTGQPPVDDWAEPTPPSDVPGIIAFSNLSSDLVLGRTHLVILAAHADNEDCELLAEELVADALARGLSVALVDAGSGRVGDQPGLAELSLDAASFGDVVQKSADNSFAEVTWGQGRIIDQDSGKPLTLVEALGDIYEVVVLLTGRVGNGSTLPMFKGLDGRVVLVAGDEDELEAVSQSRARLLAAGFDRCEIVAAPARVAA